MHARRLLVLSFVVALTILAAPAAGQRRSTHIWPILLSAPAQFNLTLAELRFGDSAGRPLGLTVNRAQGLYFVAGAVVRRPSAGGPRALILAVNERPRGSLAPDRRFIAARVTADRGLGRPTLRAVVNPLPLPIGAGRAPALCGPAAGRRALAAADLRLLDSTGRPLAGFGAAAAIAQAFDAVCGLRHNDAFTQAVSGCGASLVAGCCPPNALCAVPVSPSPAPPPAPVPVGPPSPVPTPAPPPMCPPCQRPTCTPGTACPAAVALRLIVCPRPDGCQ